MLVLAAALVVLGYGSWQAVQLPIDVLPDLNRPRVVVITEAHGLAPEEIEPLVTYPIESLLAGATGVQAVRSVSSVGISIVYVEFDWGTDAYNNRQVVSEKLQLAAERLPAGVTPQLAPISSIMGQVMIIGMWSEDDVTSPMEVRTLADWDIRQRLLTVPGVAQVFVMGGQRKQFQVLVDPDKLIAYGVTLAEVERAVTDSNTNVTGGYLDEQGAKELLVRSLGRIQSIDDLAAAVVTTRGGRPITLGQVARVALGPQVQRGDAAAAVRDADGELSGGAAVALTINKQPGADTRKLTDDILAALVDLETTLPRDIRIAPGLYQQKHFIDRAVENVADALLEGAFLVVVVLFLFLLNFRTTFITLTAIPLSVAITVLVFRWFDLSINTMTLGGLAVAIGELVDDAIVDVENIYRRLRENRARSVPRPNLLVVYQASAEIRNSIVFGTIIVVLVFLPLFALSGMEGRLFTPIGVAYVVSILSSLVVSLTVTPVLSSWLLPSVRTKTERDGWLLRQLKALAQRAIRLSIDHPGSVLASAACAVAISIMAVVGLERDLWPPFNEGSAQVNVFLEPGSSLATSRQTALVAADRIGQIDDIAALVARTGRAELDEHAEGVNVTEIVASFDPASTTPREEVLENIRGALAEVPGITVSVEQPLAHLISHMLSGVRAQVAIKLYGNDLERLRQTGAEIRDAIADVPGVRDLFVEPQVTIPQLRIELDRRQLELYGLTAHEVNQFLETAMQGRVVSRVLLADRTFDLLIRLDEPFREDREALRRLSVELRDGGTTSLSSLANIYVARGPNTINRERVRRRIVIQCNVADRGLVDTVDDIRQRLAPIQASLPSGYFIEYGGQFESQETASRVIMILFGVSLIGMFLVLYAMFRSVNFSLQVMVALPMAFIGGVAALFFTGQTLTIAAMVGFISLAGIATRNGILLLNHYRHLVQHEGETWTAEMIVRAGQERLAPVLMTALTSGIGLLPLALAAGESGKEILYPVATVIIGGLITSTTLEFLVRPALFWTVGRRAGERLIQADDSEEREWENVPADELT